MADHWGKIGCHFPAKANHNADVWNIEFLPKGGSSTSVIDRVYMVPDGVTISSVADLQHYIVWTTDVTLVPESDAVCIEFVPPYDIPLSNVAIFCNSSESSTTVNFAVYHESGLVVAKSSGDTITQNVEKFGMTGQRRLTAVSGVTLKKGLKYYIQYTNANNTFKPVVMEDWVGNYKIFSHGQIQNKNVADLNNANAWLGTIDNTMGIFTMQPGDFFMWQSSGWTPGMNNGSIYMRSNVGSNIPFAGVVGNPASSGYMTTADLNNLLSKPVGSAFIWYVNAYDDMANGSIWKKIVTIPSNLLDLSSYNDNMDCMVQILLALHDYSELVISGGQIFYKYPNSIGETYSINSNYTNRVFSATPLDALPDNLAVNDLFYLQQGFYTLPGKDQQYFNTNLYVYNGDTLLWVGNNVDSSGIDYKDVFNVGSIKSYLEYIGVNSDLTNSGWDNSYQSDGLRNATVYTDKKHYLEINGTEV